MATCLPIAWVWMQPGQLKDFSESLVAVSLFVSNFLFWSESGYFEAAAEEKPLLHTWSLAVEEQYYLIFPILLTIIWRFGRNKVFWIIILLAIISLLFSEWSWRTAKSSNFFLAPSRAWELLAGSLIALIIKKNGSGNSNLLSFSGLFAILFSVLIFDESTPFPSLFTLLPVVGVSLVILFGGEKTIVAKLLSTDPLVKLGLISYSAYLWHQPIFAFARIRLIEQPSNILMLVLMLLSFGLASVSWRFVEQPFRNKNNIYISSRTIFLFSLIGMLTFITIGFYGHIKDGFPNRFSILLKGDVEHFDYHEYIDDKYIDCEPKKIAAQALLWDGFLRCKQTKKGEPEYILLGDSHAEHLFLGLAEKLKEKNVVFYIFGAAPYLSEAKFSAIFEYLSNMTEPKTIFLNMHYFGRIQKKLDFEYEFDNTIKFLKNFNHKVILVGDIPQYKVHPGDCVYGSSLGQAQRYCSMPRSNFIEQTAVYEESLLLLAEQNEVHYIPIHLPLCNSNTCSMIQNDIILYRDKNHLNIPGSKLIGAYLAEQLNLLNKNNFSK